MIFLFQGRRKGVMNINDIPWISAASAFNGNILYDPAKDLPCGPLFHLSPSLRICSHLLPNQLFQLFFISYGIGLYPS